MTGGFVKSASQYFPRLERLDLSFVQGLIGDGVLFVQSGLSNDISDFRHVSSLRTLKVLKVFGRKVFVSRLLHVSPLNRS